MLADFGVVGGGNGRSCFNEEEEDDDAQESFFLEFCFLGIPGKCSQENGTPENRAGESILWSLIISEEDDPREKEHEENDDDEEKDGVLLELLEGFFMKELFMELWSIWYFFWRILEEKLRGGVGDEESIYDLWWSAS